MVLPPLTFMVDPTINLMSGPHHECERREHYSLYSGSTSELLLTFSQQSDPTHIFQAYIYEILQALSLSLSLQKSPRTNGNLSSSLSLSTGWLKVLDHFEFRIRGLRGGWFWSSSDSDPHGRERETQGIWVYEAWDSDLELVWFEFELDKIEGLGGDGLLFLSPTSIDVTIRRLDCREWKVGPFGWVGRDEVDMDLSFFRVKWRVCF